MSPNKQNRNVQLNEHICFIMGEYLFFVLVYTLHSYVHLKGILECNKSTRSLQKSPKFAPYRPHYPVQTTKSSHSA
jgi:uncharacterized membrane protein YhfC